MRTESEPTVVCPLVFSHQGSFSPWSASTSRPKDLAAIARLSSAQKIASPSAALLSGLATQRAQVQVPTLSGEEERVAVRAPANR
jgi:hypothetical protein